MDAFFGFLKVLVICVTALTGLCILLLVLVNYLPRSPLRDILGAISKRLGATVAVTTIAIPVDFLPGVDVAYDVLSFVFLVWYWFRLVRVIQEAYVRS